MSPEQGSSPERGKDDEHKQKVQTMLGLVVDDIREEDFEAAAHTTLEQGLISPADVIDYLDIQCKNEEDPVAQRLIRDGIRSIVAGLRERDQAENGSGSDRSLANDEVERINKVMQDMELQEMSENEVLAEEPDTDTAHDVVPDYWWDRDVFSVDLSDYTDEEIEKVRNSAGYKAIEEKATTNDTNSTAYHISQARKMIQKQGGKHKELMLLMLDGIVSTTAEEEATTNDTNSTAYHISQARKMIQNYASDKDLEHKPITARMLASLDKHIAKAAEEEATTNDTNSTAYHISQARKMIQNYASSPERAQAMLDELGL